MKIYALLDRSGSMLGRWDEALSSINAYVEGLTAKKNTRGTEVTLALFDYHGGFKYDVIRNAVPAKDWKDLSAEEAMPRGMTPLFDAIGRVTSNMLTANDEKSILVVMTDGEENHSRELNRDAAKIALDKVREKGWQVVFLGADFDATKQAASVGTQMNQTIAMAAGNYGSTMSLLSTKSAAYLSGGVRGMAFDDEDRKIASGT